MRLGLDISAIPFGTGVSRYTGNLVRALVPQLGQDELVLFGTSLRQLVVLKQYATTLPPPSPKQAFWPLPQTLSGWLFNSLHLPIHWLTGPIDVFHAWDWQIPATPVTRLVSTVHDLANFKYPQVANQVALNHHRQTLNHLKKSGAQVIAVSNSTKADLVEMFQFKPSNIAVIPEALPVEVQIQVTPDQIQLIRKRWGIAKPYFLIVGAGEKRKNLLRQIEAWQHYKHNFDLVIVGALPESGLKSQPGLITTGYLNGLDLAALYHGATLCLYVSLYEGFGLPILEAFYHQVPVVTGKTSSLPEVGGDAVAYADPLRIETIVVAIGQALARRDLLVAAGTNRLKLFSWQNVARQTLDLYHRLSS